jgi:ABC-type Fe3+ transport system permease subunit
MQAFVRVIAPLAMPGLVTGAILVFLYCWNDFLFAISLASTNNSRTVPAALAFFTGNSSLENPIGDIAAAAVIITIPILIFVLFFQRCIVAGLAVRDVNLEPRHRYGDSELRPLLAHDRAPEHGVRPVAGQGSQGRGRPEGDRGGSHPGSDPEPGP